MSTNDSPCWELMDFAPFGSYLDHDPTALMPYAVWYPINDPNVDFCEPCDFDILGAGNTPEEAIVAARRQVEEWENEAK